MVFLPPEQQQCRPLYSATGKMYTRLENGAGEVAGCTQIQERGLSAEKADVRFFKIALAPFANFQHNPYSTRLPRNTWESCGPFIA